MKVLGIRYCSVSPQAKAIATFLTALGMPQRKLDDPGLPVTEDGFAGAIFPAGDSWIELWPPGPGMPEGMMLQVIVDDSEAFAKHAVANGLTPEGPMDAHGERIYFLKTPDGMQMSFQSALPGAA